MSELLAICEAARARRAFGERLYMATVVRVRGSSYRRPGARMLFTEARWLCGSVSGGCLERDVIARAPWRTERASSSLMVYDSRVEEDEVPRLGCGGIVEILVERLSDGSGGKELDALSFLSRCLERQTCGALATIFRSSSPSIGLGARLAKFSDGAAFGALLDEREQRDLECALQEALSRGETSIYVSPRASLEALVEVVRPPPHLFVFGSGRDVLPVVAFGRLLGWEISVCDRHQRFDTRQLFSQSGAVHITPALTEIPRLLDSCARSLALVMSHDYTYDREVLCALLRSRAAYIGVLGPRHRTARMLEELAAEGRGPRAADSARLRAPVGLALGGESPDEIALSIVAELQASLGGDSARPLSERSVLHGSCRLPSVEVPKGSLP